MRKVYFFILLLALSLKSAEVPAQIVSDKSLLEKNNFIDKSVSKKRNVRFLFTKSTNPILRYNPVSLSLGGLMFVYQKYISVQIGANCPFEVSCSEFSKKCIQQFGLIKGMSLSADRLMRCTRLSASDINISDINEKTGRVKDSPDYYKNCIHAE